MKATSQVCPSGSAKTPEYPNGLSTAGRCDGRAGSSGVGADLVDCRDSVHGVAEREAAPTTGVRVDAGVLGELAA